MATWKGQSRGGTLGNKIFLLLLKNFGIAPAYWLLRFVALYYFLFSHGSNRHIHFYFRKIKGFGRVRSRLAVYRNYYIFGQVLIDKVAILSGLKEKYAFELGDEEELRKMADGGLIISAHVGNWEMAPRLSDRIERTFNVVMLDAEHRRIKAMLEEAITERKMNIIPIRDDLSHMVLISQALGRNELIAMHGDRFLEGMKTMEAKFLGHDARFPEGPFSLAARLGVAVSFAFVMKDGPRKYHFYATPAKSYAGLGKKGARQALEDYVSALEGALGRHPEQWFNYYGFWNELAIQ
jgi:predicted LPLAT superfamily acyltransferase